VTRTPLSKSKGQGHRGGHLWLLPHSLCPAHNRQVIKRWCCLTSVCLSVAYIRPKSRTERPKNTKIGAEVAHVTRDSGITFKVKRSKVEVTRPLCSPPCWRVRRLQRWVWERVGRGKLLLRCHLLGGSFSAHGRERGGGISWRPVYRSPWLRPFQFRYSLSIITIITQKRLVAFSSAVYHVWVRGISYIAFGVSIAACLQLVFIVVSSAFHWSQHLVSGRALQPDGRMMVYINTVTVTMLALFCGSHEISAATDCLIEPNEQWTLLLLL